jgi:ribonuclease-3
VSAEPSILEEKIGYRFRERGRLEQALTHRSFTQEDQARSPHNERLEFLGDSVLGFVASEGLSAQFPSYSEGQLTKLKAFLVSGANLVEVARALDLGEYLRLGRGEHKSGGRTKKALLVDALEALIAAIYLDGGLEAARSFIERAILTPPLIEAAEQNLEIDNFKSALQEWLQSHKLPLPSYRAVHEAGPPHKRHFTVELAVGKTYAVTAEGSTKKAAEQEAARLALEHFTGRAEDGTPEPDEDEQQGETEIPRTT